MVYFLDPLKGQIYKPVIGRPLGDDFVCETLNLLRSMGDRQGFVADEKRNSVSHGCSGYIGLRCDPSKSTFCSYIS